MINKTKHLDPNIYYNRAQQNLERIEKALVLNEQGKNVVDFNRYIRAYSALLEHTTNRAIKGVHPQHQARHQKLLLQLNNLKQTFQTTLASSSSSSGITLSMIAPMLKMAIITKGTVTATAALAMTAVGTLIYQTFRFLNPVYPSQASENVQEMAPEIPTFNNASSASETSQYSDLPCESTGNLEEALDIPSLPSLPPSFNDKPQEDFFKRMTLLPNETQDSSPYWLDVEEQHPITTSIPETGKSNSSSFIYSSEDLVHESSVIFTEDNVSPFKNINPFSTTLKCSDRRPKDRTDSLHVVSNTSLPFSFASSLDDENPLISKASQLNEQRTPSPYWVHGLRKYAAPITKYITAINGFHIEPSLYRPFIPSGREAAFFIGGSLLTLIPIALKSFPSLLGGNRQAAHQAFPAAGGAGAAFSAPSGSLSNPFPSAGPSGSLSALNSGSASSAVFEIPAPPSLPPPPLNLKHIDPLARIRAKKKASSGDVKGKAPAASPQLLGSISLNDILSSRESLKKVEENPPKPREKSALEMVFEGALQTRDAVDRNDEDEDEDEDWDDLNPLIHSYECNTNGEPPYSK